MTEEVVVRLKRRISRHLRNEASILEEMYSAYNAGLLTVGDINELGKHIEKVAERLAKKHPMFRACLGILAKILEYAREYAHEAMKEAKP